MTARRLLLSLFALALLAAVPAGAKSSPDVIALPNGFQPEGLAIGHSHTFYVGSIPTGAVYRGDLKTGRGAVLVQPQPGRAAIGVAVDRARIFVAGGPTGQAYVYDARSGAPLASYQLAPGAPTFINDVVVTKDGAWFTDSLRAVLYLVPVARNGTLGGQADVRTVPLRGDFQMAPGFNTNGIDATRNGKTLVIVQTNLGRLYSVDPATGKANRIELSGGDVMQGDGILLHGKRLYVVQNRLNRVAVIDLEGKLASGRILGYITRPPLLDVPTSIDRDGDRLYVVNARFDNPSPTTASYTVVQLPKVRFR